MVLYLTRSHSFIRFRGYESAVWLPNKRSGSGVQPLAALYPTVTLSPWRQVRKNIHSRVWTPVPPDLYSTQEGHPSWFPSVPVLGDMGLTPGDWSGLLSRVATHGTTRSCLPQEDFSPGPLIPRFKSFPTTRILPITLCVFSVWYRH